MKIDKQSLKELRRMDDVQFLKTLQGLLGPGASGVML